MKLLKNKFGEVSGLSLTIKVLISCVIGVLVLTFSYYIIENYYVDSVVKEESQIYKEQKTNKKQESTYAAEVVYPTFDEE